MIEIRRIDYGDPQAVAIRAAMDVEMNELYADIGDGLTDEMLANMDAAFVIHAEAMVGTVGAFDGDTLVGHAAVRPVTIDSAGDALEVKRVIVLPEYRGQGISKKLMHELEYIGWEQRVLQLVLQTGPRQREAIALYLRIGYQRIPNFGLYAPVPFLLCYGKVL